MRYWVLSMTLIAVFSFWGCSDADTLGEEPPVEVAISGEPTWDNGMGELVRLKCAYCHAVPRPAIAPANVPNDLDLNQYETRLADGAVIRGADSLGRWIFEGILDHPVTKFSGTSRPRQMPLDYATQVTSREKTFFEVWDNAGLPRDNSQEPPPGDVDRGRALYFGEGCVACHDIGTGVIIDDDVIGPPIRKESLTVAKIKSMWLHKIKPEPLSTEDAQAIKAVVLPFLSESP